MLQQPHLVQATLRSPPVRLSPSATRFMRSPHDLTTIGTSLRSIRVALSKVMDAIRAEMATIRASQYLITQQLAQLLSLHTPPPPPSP